MGPSGAPRVAGTGVWMLPEPIVVWEREVAMVQGSGVRAVPLSGRSGAAIVLLLGLGLGGCELVEGIFRVGLWAGVILVLLVVLLVWLISRLFR